MATVHVLEQQSPDSNIYNGVLHVAVPVGTNDVNTEWSVCYKASAGGRPFTSQLTVGNGVGQIGQQEMNKILSGEIIEWSFEFSDDPNTLFDSRVAELERQAANAINKQVEDFKKRYKLYGYTRG